MCNAMQDMLTDTKANITMGCIKRRRPVRGGRDKVELYHR